MARLRTLLRGLGLGRLKLAPRRISYFYWPRLSSAVRKNWLIIRNPHVDIVLGRHVYFGPGFDFHAPYGPCRLEIGEGVEFRRGVRIDLAPGARLCIGENTRMTNNALIQCGESIEIGDRCMLGQSAMLVDGNHRFRDVTRPMLEQGYEMSPVALSDDVVLMSKCTVIGAQIGERTVVGAHAVVTRDLPAFCVAVGAPARPVDSFAPDR